MATETFIDIGKVEAVERLFKDSGFTRSEGGSFTPGAGSVVRTASRLFVEGMDFDPATVSWWSRQSDDAKRAVCEGLAEPVADITVGALNYLRDIVKQYQLDSICLWAHGMDVDCAILRSLCRRFDIDLEDIIPHTQLRDCRTVILEAAYKLACQQRLEAIATAETLLQDGTPVPCPAVSPQEVLAGSRKAYDLFPPLPSQDDGITHDAIYDATRSTWYTWQALRVLRS
jgi:hypothetical protein